MEHGGGGAAQVRQRTRLRIDWGHLLVATAIAVGVVAYLLDARSVSTSTNNLLLVQPVALLAIVLYLLILPQCFRREAEEAESASPEPQASASTAEERNGLWRVLALAVVFGVFIALLETIGFDIAAWAFTLVALWIGGERRPLVLLLFPVAFAVAVILLFQMMVPYPMTTTLL